MALFRCGGGAVRYGELTTAGISDTASYKLDITWASIIAEGFTHGYLEFAGGFSSGVRAGVLIEFDTSAKTVSIVDHAEEVASAIAVTADTTNISLSSNRNVAGAYFCFA